jgi:phosphogluconate dehydratase
MGLHLPGAAFIHPHDDLRHALTVAATHQAVAISRQSKDIRPIGEILDERAFVNAIVGLHATGGSTNHTLHLPAMAATAGILLKWEDFADLSEIVPLLARIYPNGHADVNHFHAAGGIGYVIRELLDAGLVHADARTVWGNNLGDYAVEPGFGDENDVIWKPAAKQSLDNDILRPVSNPHSATGGLKMLTGSLGKSVIKISAVDPSRHIITAPAKVFNSEAEVKAAFANDQLNKDVVLVVRMQGPQANGMPELHSLTPLMSILQEQGHRVALVTDGRMSGASGKVPSAIHVCPEAVMGGAIAKIQDGDMITLDAVTGQLHVDADLDARILPAISNRPQVNAFGRPLFASLRGNAATAEQGGGVNPLIGSQ